MADVLSDFQEWWAAYPRKVGKLAALKEYQKARRIAAATKEELLAGVATYKAMKPSYADWCHPRTWLSQGRWMDEGDQSAAPAPRGSICPHVPTCQRWSECTARILEEGRAARAR